MKSTTFYQLLVDASGSMSGSEAATVSTLNEQIAMVRRLATENSAEQFQLGITDFSSDIRVVRAMDPVDSIPEINPEEYQVRDSTALYDTLGTTVVHLESAHLERKDNQGDSFVVVVVTDGYENASRHYNLNTLKSLLGRLEDTGKWEFRFIGADFLTDDFTASLNLKRAKAHRIRKNQMHSLNVYMDAEMKSLLRQKKGGDWWD